MKNKQNPIIGIVGGRGKMGQWLKNFFEQNGLQVLIAGHKTDLTIPELVHKSDIIIVSVTIAKTEEVLKQIVPLVKKNQLLTDITSLKVMPLNAMKEAKSATLGMHPLFGPSVSTPQGLKIVFCKQKNNSHVEFLKNLFTQSGIEVVEMSAEEHDYHMAYIQALTHALNLLYAKIIFAQKDALSSKLGTPVSMLQSLIMGRVLRQDLELTADIELYNPYFVSLLENLAADSKKLLSVIQKGDREGFINLFSHEQKAGHQFANFSMLQTDKILRLTSDVRSALPSKPKVGNLPKSAKVAFLGPEGTYSHQAASLIFTKDSFRKVACDTLFDVFNKVMENDADFGVVPAENSIEGTVKGTMDYLVDFQLTTVGSFEIPVHHQLLSTEKDFKSIKTVISHPQALAQCQNWLREHLSHAKLISSPSTASNIEREKGTAYISSNIAAQIHHMPVLCKNIEDNPANATKFYVIAKKQVNFKNISNSKTLIFVTVYNRVGILRDILNVLADHGLNLTKLESRPSQEKIWDYYFFIEIEKEQFDPVLIKALNKLEAYCPVIKILGQT